MSSLKLASPRGAVLASPGVRFQPQGGALSFGIGLVCYVLGTLAVGVCLLAIPGRGGAAPPDHGHGGH